MGFFFGILFEDFRDAWMIFVCFKDEIRIRELKGRSGKILRRFGIRWNLEIMATDGGGGVVEIWKL